MRFLIFVIILFSTLNLFAIEQDQLISKIDLDFLFDNNVSKWNQNVVFFEKKKTMEKITHKDSNVYSLKSNFNNGHAILTPIFLSSEVYMLNLDYNLPELHLNKINIQKHFDQMKPKICNIIELEGKNSVNIQLTKC